MKPDNMLLLEHLARYYFAFPYASGRVLDIACGTGYGTKMIAKGRKKSITSITGVDINVDTIEYARKTYFHPLLSFTAGNALDPSLRDEIGTFDTIISFETIEHVPNDRQFLKSLINLLNPGGTLLISTSFGEGRGIPCGSPFHYHQLTEDEFEALFTNPDLPFSTVDFYFQQGGCLSY
ncbi:class I SAM-dependent methyltransferase [Bacillus sp. H-16]|nr:class I SAM-dependent methyltransferase [Alteribacter salitolerans]